MQHGQRMHKTFKIACSFINKYLQGLWICQFQNLEDILFLKDSEVKRQNLYTFFLTQYSSNSEGFLWCLTIVESFMFIDSFNAQFRVGLLWKQRVI
jgi:hypothetical protein